MTMTDQPQGLAERCDRQGAAAPEVSGGAQQAAASLTATTSICSVAGSSRTISTIPTRRSRRASRRPITSPSPSSAAASPGLATGARLVEAGIKDVRIIEKGGDFGGTWYWNRYPGAQCDTASMVYMPLLEETGHMPSEKYAHAPEILAHCQRIGKQYGLYDNALFHTEVVRPRLGRRAIALDHPHQPRR